MFAALRRAWARLRHRHHARDLAEELELHRELLARDLRARGDSSDARDLARRAMGNELQAREHARAVWISPWLDQTAQDIRHGWRQLGRAPVFSVTAILLGALGVGATTAVFSAVNTLLFVPLPYPDSARLLALGTPGGGATDGQTYHALSARTATFSSVAAQRSTGGWSLVAGTHAEAASGLRVSDGYFTTIGVLPRLGRPFTRAEDTADGPNVAVISDELWRRAFDGRASVLGQQVLLGGAPYEIVGVMPAGFRSTPDAEVWTPLRLSERDNSLNYLVLGRLTGDATEAQAAAELELVKADLMAIQPEAMHPRTRTLAWLPLQKRLGLEVSFPLLLLLLAIAATTAVACANLTGLLLVRTLAREGEVATRLALGASRARVARQFLTESIVLAGLGGAAGVVATAWLMPSLARLIPASLLAGRVVALDGRVLAVAVGSTILVGLIFGLTPAVAARRFEARGAISQLRAGTPGRRHTWSRRLLLVGELAASAALLVLGGMLTTSLLRMYQADLGFDPSGITIGRVALAGEALADQHRFQSFADRALENLRAIPGVDSVAIASGAPVERGVNLPVDPSTGGLVTIPRSVDWRYVSSDYFVLLRMAVRHGRAFDGRDGASGAPVVIVNEAFAHAYFGRGNVVGQIVRSSPGLQDTPREIVGVVQDSLSKPGAGWTRGFSARGAAPPPIMYVPVGQAPLRARTASHQYFPASFMVRTRPGTGDISDAVTRAVRDVEPSVALVGIQPLTRIVDDDIQGPRVLATIVGGLTALALLIAAIGMFGLVAYTTRLRRQETAIRMALGATRAALVWSFLGETLVVAIVGSALGVAGALAASGAVQALVGDLAALDPRAVAASVAILVAVVGVATAWPAARAAREDPLTALRVS